jgi:hypothetical protein
MHWDRITSRTLLLHDEEFAMFNKRTLSALALAAAASIAPAAFAQQDATPPQNTAALLQQTDADASTALEKL